MIRKLADGRYRLYSRKKDPKTGKRRNLGTFASRTAAEKHERAVQFFKRQGYLRRRAPPNPQMQLTGRSGPGLPKAPASS